MSAKPILVTVLSPAGAVLGTYAARVSNALWRATRQRPRLHIFRVQREAEPYGDGWALRLLAGESMPRQRT